MHRIAAAALSSLATATALAQVVVVDVPQIAGSSRYLQGVLSADANYAVFTTNEGSSTRVVRWNASTNTLLEMEYLGFNSQPSLAAITNIGSVAGLRGIPRRGVVWLPSGNLATDPFPGSFMGDTNASDGGAPYFIVNNTQTTMFEWNAFGPPTTRGKPVDSDTVRPMDVNAAGNAVAIAGTSGGLGRAYRWRSGIGYDAIPLFTGLTENIALHISDDGSRVVGWANTGSTTMQGYFWSAETGLISMGLPSGALIFGMSANNDCTLVCGRYLVGGVATRFVWSLHGGLTTASAFAISRGYNPGTSAFEILDFDRSGSAALVQVGDWTKLLKNLYRAECGVSGNCFAAHSTPGCADASCCDRVCVADPFCCSNSWDSICVEEAEALCRTGSTCADARRITTLVPSSYEYNTGYDGVPSDESSCGNGDERAVWRRFRAPCTGAVTIDTCTEFAEGPIVLSVYSSCGTQIACNEGSFVQCAEARANVAFPAVAGTEYLIRIGSIAGNAYGTLSVACESSCGAPGSGSCTAVSAGTGCSDAACCGTVCVNDPYCCDVSWDSLCAAEASKWCSRPGDIDGDGDIDGADLAVILTNWGLGGVSDINGDGITNGSDLAVILANWG